MGVVLGVAVGGVISHRYSTCSAALLVHELMLHLFNGFLHRLWVESLYLSIVEEPNLTEHLTWNLSVMCGENNTVKGRTISKY